MSARVDWAKGGHARIVSIAADAIELRSTVPAPPGSRMEGTVTREGGEGEGQAVVLRVKVHASRREGEGEFVLRGRPVDLGRDGRLRLEAMVKEGEGREAV